MVNWPASYEKRVFWSNNAKYLVNIYCAGLWNGALIDSRIVTSFWKNSLGHLIRPLKVFSTNFSYQHHQFYRTLDLLHSARAFDNFHYIFNINYKCVIKFGWILIFQVLYFTPKRFIHALVYRCCWVNINILSILLILLWRWWAALSSSYSGYSAPWAVQSTAILFWSGAQNWFTYFKNTSVHLSKLPIFDQYTH